MEDTHKTAVAVELLDQALRLYYEGGSDFAALNLAGAAEEILRSFAQRRRFRLDGTAYQPWTGLDSYIEATNFALGNDEGESDDASNSAAYNALQDSYNQTKHPDRRRVPIDTVSFDARAEAYSMLDRAVISFFVAQSHPELRGLVKPTPNISRFGKDPESGPSPPDGSPEGRTS